jgi:nitroreductase
MTDFLSQLEWRFATDEFDTDKKIPEADLEKILTSIRMAPSSYGLQPYHVFVITNEELRLKLQEKGYDQAHISEASHYLVFCSRNDYMDRVDQYVDVSSGGDAEKADKLQGYANVMRRTKEGQSAEDIKLWADRQTYLALGFALAACAELEIDAAPMEGFQPPAYDELLELPEHMKSVVAMSVGYRKNDPKRGKVRFPNEDLFTTLA